MSNTYRPLISFMLLTNDSTPPLDASQIMRRVDHKLNPSPETPRIVPVYEFVSSLGCETASPAGQTILIALGIETASFLEKNCITHCFQMRIDNIVGEIVDAIRAEMAAREGQAEQPSHDPQAAATQAGGD